MSDTQTLSDGVQIDLVNGSRVKRMTTMEKIRLVLDGVRDGNIVILECGLTPDEQSRLVEVTMSEIQPNGFSGIEIESYPSDDGESEPGFLGKVFGKSSTEPDSNLTVIGPADKMRTLHKDDTVISTLVNAR